LDSTFFKESTVPTTSLGTRSAEKDKKLEENLNDPLASIEEFVAGKFLAIKKF
jgi:hypothetical protein